jgi:hypothetical protein
MATYFQSDLRVNVRSSGCDSQSGKVQYHRPGSSESAYGCGGEPWIYSGLCRVRGARVVAAVTVLPGQLETGSYMLASCRGGQGAGCCAADIVLSVRGSQAFGGALKLGW